MQCLSKFVIEKCGCRPIESKGEGRKTHCEHENNLICFQTGHRVSFSLAKTQFRILLHIRDDSSGKIFFVGSSKRILKYMCSIDLGLGALFWNQKLVTLLPEYRM